MSEVIYDAGALIAAERNDRALWADPQVRLEARLEARLEQGRSPSLRRPLSPVSRSPRQARLRRLLRDRDVTDLSEDAAHRVGRLLAQAGSADIVDGAVAEAGITRSAPIITSDRDDIAHLLQAAGVDLPINDTCSGRA